MISRQLTLTGRIIFAIPFGVFGIYRFFNIEFFESLVPDVMPWPQFWIYLTGVALVSACISILINKHTTLACLLLSGMVMTFAFSIHFPAMLTNWNDPVQRSFSMAMTMKDIALSGGALMVAGMASPQRKISSIRLFAKVNFINKLHVTETKDQRVSA